MQLFHDAAEEVRRERVLAVRIYFGALSQPCCDPWVPYVSRDDFSHFGSWCCILGTHFCHPEPTFWNLVVLKVSKEGTQGARVGFSSIFDRFKDPLWNDFWSTWLISQRFEATKFQYWFAGRFLLRFQVDFVMKSDSLVYWKHSKYVCFR